MMSERIITEYVEKVASYAVNLHIQEITTVEIHKLQNHASLIRRYVEALPTYNTYKFLPRRMVYSKLCNSCLIDSTYCGHKKIAEKKYEVLLG